MSNETLSERATAHLRELGVDGPVEPEHTKGSSDVGAVSQKCPTIHAWFDVSGDDSIRTHMVEFEKCTGSDYGIANMFVQAAALAMTGEDVLKEPQFLADAKEEYEIRLKEI